MWRKYPNIRLLLEDTFFQKKKKKKKKKKKGIKIENKSLDNDKVTWEHPQ